jgi:hypothetical protein
MLPPLFTDAGAVVALLLPALVVVVLDFGLLLQAANTRAAPATSAPICIPLLSLLTPWTSSVLARRGLAFPSRKVTRTLPFLCDFRWEGTENWAFSDILPGQDPEARESPISGPLHFSSCQRQTRTARRAREPQAGVPRPPDQEPQAGQSPRAPGRRGRGPAPGAPTRRGRRRDPMVANRPGRSPTGAAPTNRGTARPRGDREVLGMHPLGIQLAEAQRAEPQLAVSRQAGSELAATDRPAIGGRARESQARESGTDRSGKVRPPVEGQIQQGESRVLREGPVHRARLVRCADPIRPHLRAGAALPGEEHAYSVKTPKQPKSKERGLLGGDAVRGPSR